MNIEQKENGSAYLLVMEAKDHVKDMYATPEDRQVGTVALLWAAFVKSAKEAGLDNWRGMPLE